MAGEAEVDEPFVEQAPGHLLQHCDAPPVHLDQVVIGPKDGGDAALDWKGREVKSWRSIEDAERKNRLGRHLPV